MFPALSEAASRPTTSGVTSGVIDTIISWWLSVFLQIYFQEDFMHSITLSGKGEVTIPKPFRDALHWKPGQQFEVITVGGGAVLLRPVHHFAPATLDQVAACLLRPPP